MSRFATIGCRFVLAFGSVLFAGCTGYGQPELEVFRKDVLDRHPVGSSIVALEDALIPNGFGWTGNGLVPTARGYDADEKCLSRNLAYGFWGVGSRRVCIVGQDGTIKKIDVRQFVAGL